MAELNVDDIINNYIKAEAKRMAEFKKHMDAVNVILNDSRKMLNEMILAIKINSLLNDEIDMENE